MNETKATRYQRLKRRTHAVAVACGGVMLALLAMTPASRWLADWVSGAGRGLAAPLSGAVALAAFVGCSVALWELMALPAVGYLALVIDRRFARGGATVESVIGAQARATAVGVAGALAAAGAIEVAARSAGSWWWLAAAALLSSARAAAMRVAPDLVVRFGGARPVARGALRAQLAALTDRAGVTVAGVDEWRGGESLGAAALVTGIGRTRRVFLSPELLADWSDDEIAVVVAHELGHHAHRDLWRALALDALVLAAALWTAHLAISWSGARLALSGPRDLAALPLLALVAGGVWLLATPLRHAQSRAHERRADKFALALTGGSEAFSAAIRRLGDRHLAEERPSRLTRWLYYRHPSVAERLALADTFQRPTS